MREELYLVDLCKAYLDSKRIMLDESIDYEKLYDACKAQNLIAIAFCVIKQSKNKDIVPIEVYNKFEASFFDTIMLYSQQSGVITEIEGLLSDNKIRHIFFKGAQIRDYYPVPEARAMSDIDLLIDADNRDIVKDLLVSNGYSLKNSNGPVYDYIRGNVLIEVHTSIVNGKVGNSNAGEYFRSAIDNGVYDGFAGALDSEYNLAYLITHLAHHFWFYGAGIKLILDLAVYQRHFDIDYDRLFEIMEDIGLSDFARLAVGISYKWFGTGVEYVGDTERTEEFLTSYGAFGNKNRNVAAVIKRKELEEGKTDNTFIVKIRMLFPSYKKMKEIPYIRFIEGRPWLTPLAWIYRLFYIFKNRRGLAINVAKEMNDEKTSTEAENELRYFEEIGLL